ncbi:MAG: alpha/beta fold hydrolase [Acidimicrobiia bacterium]
MDEFSLLAENAEEFGLVWTGPPTVTRVETPIDGTRALRAIAWGETPAHAVLLHGGAQNAHTWDTVALALGHPLLAIDLPGHGRSDWRTDHHYSVKGNATDVAAAMDSLIGAPRPVIGMSLGGLTTIALGAARPELVTRMMLVDVTPGVNREKAEPITAFVSGPENFASFDEILERTVQFNPTRSVASLRRGILHNAVENPDGTWRWRYDRMRLSTAHDEEGHHGSVPDFGGLWDELEGYPGPIWLVRGSTSGVVSDDDVTELQRRRPDAHVEVVDGAGHSVQGDRPVELAALIEEFLR